MKIAEKAIDVLEAVLNHGGKNNGIIAAISLSAHSPSISSMKMRQLAPKVKSYALEISRAIGYEGN